MAKKSTSIPDADDEINVTPNDLAEAANDYIAQMGDAVPVFSPTAPIMLSTYTEGGSKPGFRNANIDAGQEFILLAIRPGKRSDFVVEFSPMDTRPYERCEMADVRLEVLSPATDAFLAEAVGFKGHSWKEAKLKFFKEKTRSIAEVKAAEEAKAKQEQESFYNNDPLYGAFA